MVANIYFDMA